MHRIALRTLAVTYAHGTVIDQHVHGWGQLVYASSGAIEVVAQQGRWLVPPARAVWLPPNAAHRLTMRGVSALKSIYVEPRLCRALPPCCSALAVTALLRELILAIVAKGVQSLQQPGALAHAQLLAVLLAEAVALPLALRLPEDARAARAAQAMLQDPAGACSLAVLARAAHTSPRTLQRLFLAETGLHLSAWRQVARMLCARRCLIDGQRVTETGLACGYETTSGFIAAFRRHMGVTPAHYRRQYAGVRGAPSGVAGLVAGEVPSGRGQERRC